MGLCVSVGPLKALTKMSDGKNIELLASEHDSFSMQTESGTVTGKTLTGRGMQAIGADRRGP